MKRCSRLPAQGSWKVGRHFYKLQSNCRQRAEVFISALPCWNSREALQEVLKTLAGSVASTFSSHNILG